MAATLEEEVLEDLVMRLYEYAYRSLQLEDETRPINAVIRNTGTLPPQDERKFRVLVQETQRVAQGMADDLAQIQRIVPEGREFVANALGEDCNLDLRGPYIGVIDSILLN